ncbi:MAG: isocitrate lyase/phosphoenolpyruvate mutase family protein [Gammaproteobacteria bacterium]|nr:isocitrate lyase/phosphoenolpyruvate mutase family protein [Gammaproteobacteria bacterium]
MSSRWTERRQQLRSVLSERRCVYPASVFDPISARIAEDLGFEVGMFAGSVASMTVLGAPDLIVLTLSEFAEQSYRICRAGGLPLLVDADHGYGNALNVMRTVEELENAGVSALSIEDTELPTPFGNRPKPRLISVGEGVGKVRAALQARRDRELVIAGRTSVRAARDFEDVINRAVAYERAGADVIFVVGVKTRDQLETLSGSLRGPIILGGAAAELMDSEYLADNRVRICLQGHQPFAAAVEAVHETLKALRQGVVPAKLDNLAAKDLMGRVSRDADYERWIDDYLTPRPVT